MTDTPSNIQSAVTAVMLDVKRLKKADNNAFAKYRYTSVDDFKDALRPMLSERGLSARMTETSCEILEGKSADKRDAKFAFAITLEHTSGVVSEPENITVILPYVGAQTTGQARSYALKEWLKSRFMASSGDSEDADAHDTTEELSKADARALFAELQEELRLATKAGKTTMEAWAESRRPSLEVLPKDWRLRLQVQYREGLATGRTTLPQKSPLTPTGVAEFLAEIEDTLSRARSVDEVEQFFDELDVQSRLSDDEDALTKAFVIRNLRANSFGKGAAN